MSGQPRKLAIVTGGAKGLGRHLCLRLAGAGYDVIVNYLSSGAEADALVAEIGAQGATAWKFRADVAQAAEVAALFDAADTIVNSGGRELALVINNVGIYDPVALREIGGDQWERTIATNLNGAFHVCRQALRRLKRGGQIVNIGASTSASPVTSSTRPRASPPTIMSARPHCCSLPAPWRRNTPPTASA
jgi:3-oxoacyl-[acyl-carrier protein] reductase